MFLPGLGSQMESIPSWLCHPEVGMWWVLQSGYSAGFLTACTELSQEARDVLLAMAALRSLGYGGTTEARP